MSATSGSSNGLTPVAVAPPEGLAAACETQLSMQVERRDGTHTRLFGARELVIAGWTGRDRQKVQAHIEELAELGVPSPAATPVYYRTSAARLTAASHIDVLGSESSGEVEFVILNDQGELFIGVGSDHTDRWLERYSVALAKQVCEKPLAGVVWPFSEVADHWDELVLRSYIRDNGDRQLYQEGEVSAILRPSELCHHYAGSAQGRHGLLLFGGTLPAKGGVRPAARFDGELIDPRLGRQIVFGYDVTVLPVAE